MPEVSIAVKAVASPGPRLAQLLKRLANDADRHDSKLRREQRYAVQTPVWLGVFTGRGQLDQISGQRCDAALRADAATVNDACGCDGPGTFRALYRAWATDLSLHGIGLLTDQDLTPHTQLSVSLDALTHQPLYVPMRVVYCKQLLPQTYRIGGAFLLDV